jgi:hypothetical protein
VSHRRRDDPSDMGGLLIGGGGERRKRLEVLSLGMGAEDLFSSVLGSVWAPEGGPGAHR